MGTQLVPLVRETARSTGGGRPLAGFVAQVIAGEQGLAGQRRRRRAAPAEASALYRAAEAGGAPARPSAERRV